MLTDGFRYKKKHFLNHIILRSNRNNDYRGWKIFYDVRIKNDICYSKTVLDIIKFVVNNARKEILNQSMALENHEIKEIREST